AYAAGAATSLTAALLLGGRAMDWMKRSLGVGEWLRRGLGALVIVAVATIAMGVDSGLLARVSLASTGGLEQQLLAGVEAAAAAAGARGAGERGGGKQCDGRGQRPAGARVAGQYRRPRAATAGGREARDGG